MKFVKTKANVNMEHAKKDTQRSAGISPKMESADIGQNVLIGMHKK